MASVVDASPYLAELTFRVQGGTAASAPGVPSSFGVLLRTDADLGGWYLTLDRLRGSVHLARWPHPLDDFWADLVGRGQERREVDGPFTDEARWSAAGNEVRVSLLVEGPLVEVYVDDAVALTHRIPADAGTNELGVFVVDGTIDVGVAVRALP